MSSEELCTLTSWFLSLMRSNIALEELRVNRFAVILEDIC